MSRPGKYLALAMPALFLTLLLINPRAMTQDRPADTSPARQVLVLRQEAPDPEPSAPPAESLLTLRMAEAELTEALDLPVGPLPSQVPGHNDVVSAPADPPPQAMPQRRYVVYRMLVTAYCPCRRCCGRFSDGKTASGKSIYTNDCQFVAADTGVVPFGTELSIPGYADGQPVPVEDRGGAIKGHRLDVFFLSHHQARQWGSQWLDVKVYLD